MPDTVAAVNISDLRAQYLDEFLGLVESQFSASSIMGGIYTLKPVRGTDTIVADRIGKTELQALVNGASPNPTAVAFGRVSLTVDTVILARAAKTMLSEFQDHFDVRKEIAEDQGKEHAKFFDQAFIIQAIKGANQAAPAGLGGAIGAGKKKTLAAANDELDPDKLYAAISGILTEMEEEDIDTTSSVILVSPKIFKVLKDHDKLGSRDFSADNVDFARNILHHLDGVPITKTNRIPNAAIAAHKLGAAYNVSAAEAKAVAVILHPKSLLAGESIPLTGDFWFNDSNKMYFIDSWRAFGVTVNRPDVCGAVFKA